MLKMISTYLAGILIVILGVGIGAFYAGIITTYAVNCALGSLCYWISGKIRNLIVRMLFLMLAVMSVCMAFSLVISCLTK